ncbi:hypothetical protein [Sphingopyxis sp. QXT-31]|uniref:hypothetical protein n=1 Tax=Sphingopyxis sp. QXT-31 TaxID=1357916 RepID=UPI0018DC2D64|nr:hypothetical protein [Sphingopyxis sp. QXT-31]
MIGTESAFSKLDNAWRKMLAEPLPGKPALRKFSLGDCRSAQGEFKDYRPVERDALRYEVRQIIAAADLHSIAYCIPIATYDRIIRGRVRKAYGPPDGVAFASCADYALQVAETLRGSPIACIFDQGQERPWLTAFLRAAEERASAKGITTSYSFGAVIDHCGLQAADTIATEHYWQYKRNAGADVPVSDPHFDSLLRHNKPAGWILHEADLQRLRRDYLRERPLRDYLKTAKKRYD